jgi:hypothetical protein
MTSKLNKSEPSKKNPSFLKHEKQFCNKCVDKVLTDDELENMLYNLSNNSRKRLEVNLDNFGLTNIKEFGKVLKACGGIIAGSFVTNAVLPFLGSNTGMKYSDDEDEDKPCEYVYNAPNDIDIFVYYGARYPAENVMPPQRYKRIELLHRYLYTYGFKLDRQMKDNYKEDYFTQEGMTIRSVYPYENSDGKKIQVIFTEKSPLKEIEHFDLTICKAYWDGEKFGNTDIEYIIEDDITNVKPARLQKYLDRGFVCKS